jgi:hypothetical protein
MKFKGQIKNEVNYYSLLRTSKFLFSNLLLYIDNFKMTILQINVFAYLSNIDTMVFRVKRVKHSNAKRGGRGISNL